MYKVTQKTCKQDGTRKHPPAKRRCGREAYRPLVSGVVFSALFTQGNKTQGCAGDPPSREKTCANYDVHSCSPHHRAPGRRGGREKKAWRKVKNVMWMFGEMDMHPEKYGPQKKNKKNKIHVKKTNELHRQPLRHGPKIEKIQSTKRQQHKKVFVFLLRMRRATSGDVTRTRRDSSCLKAAE